MANLSLRAHKEAPNTPFHQTLAHAHLIPCQLKENTDDYTNCTTTSIVAPKSRHSMWLKASAGLELCMVCECGNPCKPTLITRKTRLASQANKAHTNFELPKTHAQQCRKSMQVRRHTGRHARGHTQDLCTKHSIVACRDQKHAVQASHGTTRTQLAQRHLMHSTCT